MVGREWARSGKVCVWELEVLQNAHDHDRIDDGGDDPHGTATRGAEQRQHLLDSSEEEGRPRRVEACRGRTAAKTLTSSLPNQPCVPERREDVHLRVWLDAPTIRRGQPRSTLIVPELGRGPESVQSTIKAGNGSHTLGPLTRRRR